MSDTIKGILFALAAAGIYGLTPPFTRLAFAHGVPSLETMMWRVIALVIVFSVIVLLRRISLKVPDRAGAGLSVDWRFLCISEQPGSDVPADT